MKRWLLGAVSALALVGVAGVAHAAPISATVVAAIGLTGTAATIATAVTSFLITSAVSFGINKLMTPKMRGGSQERQASVLNLSIGEVPREAVFGRACTGGSLADACNYGGEYGTDWEVQVIALADHYCEALEGFYVGDKYVAYTGDGPVDGYEGQLEVYFRHGANSEEGFPVSMQSLLPALANGSLRGVCKVAVAYKADKADDETPVWASGRPTFKWVLKGARCYDPRKDSTVPGGSGSHRWDDIETHEWTENAEICRYNYSRGIYAYGQVNDPARLRVGRGLSTYEAPPERVFAPANLCDELVEGPDGVSEARYRIGGVIKADEDFDVVEEFFAAAMGGFVIQPEGGVAVEPGQARTPVAYITDDDLCSGVSVRFSPFRSDAKRVNTILPRYIEPAQGWVDTAGDVCRDMVDVLAEGVRDEPLSLILVNYRSQAMRLAEMKRRSLRLERSAQITLPPEFADLEEGDWIEWTSERHTGGEPVVFRVVAYGLDEAYRNTLSLEETAFSVYGFGGEYTPSTPGEGVPPPDALALASVTAEAIQIEGSDGSLIPAVRFGWAEPVDPAILRIRSEVRPIAGGTSTYDTTDAVNSGSLITTNGLGAMTSIEARLFPVGQAGRPIVPSAWFALSLGELVASKSYAAETIGGKTTAQWADFFAEQVDRGRALTKAVAEAALQIVQERGQLLNETFHGGKRVKRILIDEDFAWEEGDLSLWRRTAGIAFLGEDGHTMVLNKDELMWDEVSGRSMASHLTFVQTTLNNNIATAVAETKTWVDNESAGAQWIQELEVEFGYNFHGSITDIAEVVSNIGARWVLALNVNGHISGITAVNTGASSSLVFQATQIGFSNGSSTYFPLAVSGGEVLATNFRVDKVFARSIDTLELKIGGVLTDNVGGNAITDSFYSQQGSGANIAGGFVEVFSYYVTTISGEDVDLNWFVIIENYDVAQNTCVVSIKWDSSEIDRQGWKYESGPYGDQKASFTTKQNATAGTHQVTIELYADGSASSVYANTCRVVGSRKKR